MPTSKVKTNRIAPGLKDADVFSQTIRTVPIRAARPYVPKPPVPTVQQVIPSADQVRTHNLRMLSLHGVHFQ